MYPVQIIVRKQTDTVFPLGVFIYILKYGIRICEQKRQIFKKLPRFAKQFLHLLEVVFGFFKKVDAQKGNGNTFA